MEFTRQPFQYDVDTDFFFPGGARGDVVEDIIAALSDGVPLVTLAGTDGSGKTMICRMVEQRLGGAYRILFFERGVESFDEVLEGISAQTGIDQGDKTDDRNLRLTRIVEILKQEGRRLIVIIDGAESIFLATLERIRRMVDLANGDATTIQLLLSGQPLFLLNFKQLGIVTFQDIEERNYTLDPLDAETTYHYLNHCIKIAADDTQDFFSPRMADRIMDTARGNFRLINRLADRYVKTGSLMDPEGDGFDETESDEPVISVDDNGRISAPSGLGNVDLDFLKVPRLKYQWYVVAGGIIGLILIVFLLIGGDDEVVETVQEIEEVPDLRLDKVEPDPIEIPQVLERPKPQVIVEQERPEEESVVETAAELSDVQEEPEAAEEQAAGVEEEIEAASSAPVETPESIETASVEEPAEPEPDAVNETEQAEEHGAEALLKQAVAEKPVEQQLASPERMIGGDNAETESARQAEPGGGEIPVEPVASRPPAEEPEVIEVQQESTVSEAVVEPVASRPPAEEPEVIEVQQESTVSEAVVEPVASRPPAEEPEVIEVQQESTVSEAVVEPEAADIADQAEPAAPERADVEEAGESSTPPQLTDDPKKVEKVIEAEVIQIPELAVAAKKQQRTETVPFTVVTLKDERKRPPKVEAPAPVPKPEPVAVSSEQAQPEAPKRVETEPVPPPEIPQTPVVAVRKPAPQVVPPVQQVQETAKPQNTRAYYAERLAAGSRWLVGGGRDKYTVQLMVLQSELAEKNIGTMLNETGYQSIKDQTYILRKAGEPQTVTLYFGEFDSQEEARLAQRQLPQFLQDMKPYTVAVNDAVNKARSNR